MIVIDTDDYAASGIETFFFSGGEPHAKVPESYIRDHTDIIFKAYLRTWNDVAKVLAVASSFYSNDDPDTGESDVHLYLVAGYFPGARQDRNPITDGIMTPCTLDLYINILTLYFDDVLCFDIHSSVGAYDVGSYCFDILDMSAFPPDYAGLIQPDAGAKNRTEDFQHWYEKQYNQKLPIIAFDKERDFNTGRIVGYKQIDPFPEPGRYLVVDDICDGGRTFNQLAEYADPDTVDFDLYVSHGIFSQGLSAISNAYGSIYTTDTFYNPTVGYDDPDYLHNKDRIKVVPVMNKIVDYVIRDISYRRSQEEAAQ